MFSMCSTHLYIKADFSTQKTSKVLALNMKSLSCPAASAARAGSCDGATALEFLLALAALACCGAGTKDIH